MYQTRQLANIMFIGIAGYTASTGNEVKKALNGRNSVAIRLIQQTITHK